MNRNEREYRAVSRRAFLGAVGGGTVALAGCIGGGDGSNADPTVTDDPPVRGEPDADPTVTDDPPVRGDPDADVTLEVYEDFSCPHCRSYNLQDLPAVAEQYLEPGLIRYEHRDFPFIDDQSWQAANAAREAYREHGDETFWEYKSQLFVRQNDVGTGAPEIFGEIASNLDLDSETIQAAAEERRHDDILSGDKNRGEDHGVSGTPSFVLDGELVEGNLFAEIDAALR